MNHPIKHQLLLVALPLCLSIQVCQAQGTQASVVRPTDLKAQAFSDAATIKVLPENLKIDVLSRKASWMEVKAQGSLGWVKMLSLRFDSGTPSSGGLASATKGMFDAARSGGTASTVTTGAKGFDKSKFENPTPNLDALAKMKQFSAPKGDASNFAKQEKLQEQNQTYLKAPGDKS